jgi:hypothetical protein
MRYKSIPALTPRQQDNFWKKVEVHQPSGCWQWTGCLHRLGYGNLAINHPPVRSYSLMAHRVAYTLLIGPIPEDMTVDHLCRNRGCVNPDHMQIVTLKENIHRSFHPNQISRRSGACRKGHREFRVDRRQQVCKVCERESQARYKARKKAGLVT